MACCRAFQSVRLFLCVKMSTLQGREGKKFIFYIYDFNYLHDGDISYIVLYFRLSYETLFGKTYVRTLVVCSSGISSAKLLMKQLQNMFDVLQIVGCCSIAEVERVVAENLVELIISVLLLQSHLPCVVVQAILQKQDVKPANKKSSP